MDNNIDNKMSKEELKALKVNNKIEITKLIYKFIKGVITVFCMVLLFTLFLIIFTGTSTIYREGGSDEIAVLHVNGVISSASTDGYNHTMFLDHLENVFKEKKVKAVIIQMDTPGGGVMESEEIYNKINQLRKEYNKPYISYFNSMAASGGYYISANADKIVANRQTITGSIGVIMSSLNLGELFEKYGIKNEVIKSGKHKDILSAYRPMTEEERNILQSLIDESYGYFVDIVVDGRGLPREEVLKIADGRVYTAKQAKELHLIDEIGDLDKAIEVAEQLSNTKNTTVKEYYQTTVLSQLGGALFNKNKSFVELDNLKLNLKDVENRPMYLYSR